MSEIEDDLTRSYDADGLFRVESTLLTGALLEAKNVELTRRSLREPKSLPLAAGTCFEFSYFTHDEAVGFFRDVVAAAEDISGELRPLGFVVQDNGTEIGPKYYRNPLLNYRFKNTAIACSAKPLEIGKGVAVHFTPRFRGSPRATLVWRVNQPEIRKVPPNG